MWQFREIDRIDVQPEDVLLLLNGDKTITSVAAWREKLGAVYALRNALVYCDGRLMASIISIKQGWLLTHLACDHPCHGTHLRYSELYKKLISLGIGNKYKVSECPKCDGSGLLSIDSYNGRQSVKLMQGMGVFRGVRLLQNHKQEQLNVDNVHGTVEAFLSGVCKASRGASVSPVGVVSDRALLFKQEKSNV